MLRRVLAVWVCVIAAAAAHAADKPAGVTGVYLTTRYPALTVRAGETTTIDLSLRNFGSPPQSFALSAPQVADGWKATILGGGQPIEQATVAPDSEEKLQLRLEPPAAAGPGDYRFLVEARGPGSELKLPITLTIGKELPAKLKLTTNFPALRGTATTAFKFKVTVANDSGREATINFSATAPKNFQLTFTEAYGSQQLTSIPIEAGKSKDIEASVALPRDTPAGDYKLVLHAKSEAASADLDLAVTILGQPRLALAGEGGRLSGEAYAGKPSPLDRRRAQRRQRGGARCRAQRHRARGLEDELRAEAAGRARRRQVAIGPGHDDPVRARHRRRLSDDDPRQCDRRPVGIGEFPHHRPDLDPVGRGRDRRHRRGAPGRRLRGRPLRPALARAPWPATSSSAPRA